MKQNPAYSFGSYFALPRSLPSSSHLSLLPALPIPISWPHLKHTFIVSQSKVTITKPNTKCPESCIKGRLCYERVPVEFLTIWSRKCTSLPFYTHPWSSSLTLVPEKPHGFPGPPHPLSALKSDSEELGHPHSGDPISHFPRPLPNSAPSLKRADTWISTMFPKRPTEVLCLDVLSVFLWDRVTLCSWGHRWASDSPTSTSQMLGLSVCSVMLSLCGTGGSNSGLCTD